MLLCITNQTSTAMCKENGKWSNSPPACEIKIPVPNLLLKANQEHSLKQPTKAKKTDFQN